MGFYTGASFPEKLDTLTTLAELAIRKKNTIATNCRIVNECLQTFS